MKHEVNMAPPKLPRSSASAMAMIRDPRVLHVYPDHTVFKLVPAPKVEVPLTVVVTVEAVDYLEDAFRSLLVQEYSNFNVIIVCLSPKNHKTVEGFVARYQEFFPSLKLLSLKSAGWPADALNGALPAIQTEYWCWMGASDIIHPRALAVVANAILESEADYYSTCRYHMRADWLVEASVVPMNPSDEALWSGAVFPYDRLITYRMSALVGVGGFVSYDRYPGDTAWLAAYKMKAAGCQFRHIPAAVYFERMGRKGTEVAASAGYRQAILLQHWPAFYVEAPDEEVVSQLLAPVEAEKRCGSKATG